MSMKRLWMLILLVYSLSLIQLYGCGGGGGNAVSEGVGGTQDVSGTISGAAIKGPVADATVTAFSIKSDGTKGEQIGAGKTDAQGNFSLAVGDYSGPVMLQMTGGSYTDEATGVNMNMGHLDSLTCVISFMPAGFMMSGIQMTPLTSMAQNMAQFMAGGMTPANITTANTAIAKYFSIGNILFTTPMNPLVLNAGNGADQNMKNYGMAIAAMSEYAKMKGLDHSSNMVSAMMNDVADGHMDGMMGGTAITMGGGMMNGPMPGGMMDGTGQGGNMMSPDAGTSGLAAAMINFVQSPMNKSGVTVQEVKALIDKLNASNGIIQ